MEFNMDQDPLKIVINNSENALQRKFQRRLIREVRLFPQLYDPANKNFSNKTSKDNIWLHIAKKMKSDDEICKNMWAELRVEYQRHVRRLRNFFRMRNKKKRPIMALETELIFLWRIISTKKQYSSLPYKKELLMDENNVALSTSNQEDDDIIMIENKPVVINIEDDDDNLPRCTSVYSKLATANDIKRLADIVQKHPELYDTDHIFYKDYKRKGTIWNGIANNLNDKSTKLMKLWFNLQTRYEWELMNIPLNSTIKAQKEKSHVLCMLQFLEPYIRANKNTVYKQSHYLKKEWYQPIDSFKSIFNLIATLKKFPALIEITETECFKAVKSQEYLMFWDEVATLRGFTPGQCEVTWLMLRMFYFELNYMRINGYQLQDKWFFETVVGNLFCHVKKSSETKIDIDSTSHSTVSAQPIIVPAQSIKLIAAPNSTNPLPLIASVCSQNINSNVSSIQSKIALNTVQNHLGNAITNSQQQPSVHRKLLARNTPVIAPKPIVSTAANGKASSSTAIPIGIVLSKKTENLQTPQLPKDSTIIYKENEIKKLQNVGTTQITLRKTPTHVKIPKIAKACTLSKQNSLAIANYGTIINIPQLYPGQINTEKLNGAQVNDVQSNPGQSSAGKSNVGLFNSGLSNIRQLNDRQRSTGQFKISNKILPIKGSASSKLKELLQPSIGKEPELNQSRNAAVVAPVAQIFGLSMNQSGTNHVVPATHSGLNSTTTTHSLPTNNSTMSVNQLHNTEVMIQFITSSNGKQLIVHGPAISETYTLSIPKTSRFIREILSIPQLHNPALSKTPEVMNYWQYLSKRFYMPVEICRACWNFLAENFEYFPEIAPMEELMKPFNTPNIKVWEESNDLFANFDNYTKKEGWTSYITTCVRLMDVMKNCENFYKFVIAHPNKADIPRHTRAKSQWAAICQHFAPECNSFLEKMQMYIAFHNVFWEFMSDLHRGVLNRWSRLWWPVLAKMKFLMEERYKKTEPFYYIVQNKINEEIKRCETEARAITAHVASLKTTRAVDNIQAGGTKANSIIDYNTPNIDAYNVISAIRRYPNIYKICDKWDKINAWTEVAQELNSTELSCCEAFQRALKLYRTVKIIDPSNRCRMTHKYFRNMDEIYRSVKKSKGAGGLNIKTPSELNQSVPDDAHSSEIFYPERFIFDINMDSCKTSLVMKNWAYAIGNLSNKTQIELEEKLKSVFEKYISNS